MSVSRLFVLLVALPVVSVILVACASGSDTAVSQSNDRSDGVVQVIVSGTIVPPDRPTQRPLKVDLTDLGPAPEINNDLWINTETPITLASQRGKVVLIEFWTFG